MKTLACFVLFGFAVWGQSARPVEELQTTAGVVRITPIRHASLLLQSGSQAIYVDPVAQGGSYEGLPLASLILITHTHGDHLDPTLIAKLRKGGTAIVAPEAALKSLPGASVIHAGEKKSVGAWSIEAVPAYNIKRGPAEGRRFHERGVGLGYVLAYGGKRFYIAGDTENIPEMKNLGNIDAAFLCINLPYTMTPEEAAESARIIKPKVVYPYHYRGSDLRILEKALQGSGIEVRIRDWYY
jgi:L-ascorbate metabolism protein UlaG (beta-lactamase superfamily)